MSISDAVQPQFRSYAAPREHISALIEPPLTAMGDLVTQNRQLASQWDVDLSSLSISELRRQAREELWRAARDYVSSYSNLAESYSFDTGTELILAGHQPQLFHPGVWFKNFALSKIADSRGAIAINLVVDNDLCSSASIQAPARAGDVWRREAIAFDQPLAVAVPYEQRPLFDEELFASFPARVRQVIGRWNSEPLVERLWPLALAAAAQRPNLGYALARSRHVLEQEVGLRTLEVPLSDVCDGPSFRAFLLAILTELPRFQDCYNHSLQQYRAAHRIRSSAHPVPALGEQDGWLEAPLWIYGDDDAKRRPLWARLSERGLEISDLRHRSLVIDQRYDGQAAVDQLQSLCGNQFKIRPRALITTMYARLVLSDLFLHGIGGAKYDQLGDMVAQRFFGIEPPQYGVLSATVLLPISEAPEGQRSSRQVQDDLRRLRFAPEQFAEQEGIADELVEEKRSLLRSIPARGIRSGWHQRMTAVNQQMEASLAGLRSRLENELVITEESARQGRLRDSREYPFVLYSLDDLLEAFARLGV